jgi:hypothetical protein
MNGALEQFDWVAARAKCSIGVVFERLREQVKIDIEARQRQTERDRHYAFKFVSEGRMFAALVEGHQIHDVTSFVLQDDAIEVRDKEKTLFTSTVGLNNEGRCIVKIGNQEYELWQFRKLALEHLLFAKY